MSEPRSRDKLRAAIVLLLIHHTDDVPGGAMPTDEDYTEGGEIPARRHILNGAAIRNIEHAERRRSYTLLDAALRSLEESHPAQFRVIHRMFLDEHASFGSEMKRLKERAALKPVEPPKPEAPKDKDSETPEEAYKRGVRDAEARCEWRMEEMKRKAVVSAAGRDLVRYNGGVEFLVDFLAPYDAHEELWSPAGPDVEAEEKQRTRTREQAYLYYRKKLKEHGDRARAVREAAGHSGYHLASIYRIIAVEEEYAC